jgi:hypothetical protein
VGGGTYWNFCGGDTVSIYFYPACMQTGILRSAASKMPGSSISSGGGGGHPVRIAQTEDGKAVVGHKRNLLELKLKTAKDDAMEKLTVSYEEAVEALSVYERLNP